MSSFWTDLENAAKAALSGFEAAIKSIALQIKPVVIASAEDLAKAALQAVITAAPLVISGDMKLKTATSQVLTTLGAAGKVALAADAQAAVQIAYNTIAASLTPPAQQ